jgi:hypothetical protein
MAIKVNPMTEQEWKQLKEMRDCIRTSGMQSFDPAYMDSYAQLLAKSLAGKGDMIQHQTPTNY